MASADLAVRRAGVPFHPVDGPGRVPARHCVVVDGPAGLPRQRSCRRSKGATMNYRRLGKDGVKVGEIGFGNWLTQGEGGVSADVARACIRRAFELGVNFFDTADIYRRGLAEEVFGRELKAFRRQDLVLATKLFRPMSDNINDRGLSRKHIVESVHNSLRRLQTDYIDLYQCHSFDPEV